jgi:predicted short-subunit dehydrogenase-like oxidoreductase (DUF2520 family)
MEQSLEISEYIVVDRKNTFDKNALSKCTVVTKLELVPENADLYIISVRDKAISQVSEHLSKYIPKESMVVHTSGSCDLSSLSAFSNQASMWPIQSLTYGVPIPAEDIPWSICTENKDVGLRLLNIIHSFGCPSFIMDDVQKAKLHLGAVAVNNFTNHIYYLVDLFLKESGGSIKELMPLIKYTIAKLDTLDPYDAQTGPARRNDLVTIHRHKELLAKEPGLHQIYNLITQSILDLYKQEIQKDN